MAVLKKGASAQYIIITFGEEQPHLLTTPAPFIASLFVFTVLQLLTTTEHTPASRRDTHKIKINFSRDHMKKY